MYDAEPVSNTVTCDTTLDSAILRVFVYDEDGSPDTIVRWCARNEDGDWVANFSYEGPGQDEKRLWTLVRGNSGGVNQYDEDGDATTVHWHIPDPGFSARPASDSVVLWDWPADSIIRVQVHSAGTLVFDSPIPVDGEGRAEISVEPHDLAAGDVVTVSLYDDIVKQTTVRNLSVTSVSTDQDMVAGTADPNTEFVVDAITAAGQLVTSRHYGTGSGSSWGVSLNTGPDPFDIVPGSWGWARINDEDGDNTAVQWHAANPPVTTTLFEPTRPSSGWWSSDVTMTLTTDPMGEDGISEIFYMVTPPGGGLETGFTGDLTLTLPKFTQEGTTTIEYRATNLWSDREEWKTAYVKIDGTAPSKPDTPTASGITQTSAVLSWPAVTDPVSGLAAYQVYRGSTLVTTTINTSYTATGLSAGATYTFTVKALDVAGNVSASSDPRSVTTQSGGGPGPGGGGPPSPPPDTLAPTVSAVVSHAGWANVANATVTITASDDSGQVTLAYSGADVPKSGPSPQSAIVNVAAEGETTVNFTATDAAGHATAGSAIVRIDRTAPPTPGAPSYATLTGDTVMLAWTPVSEPHSYVASYDVYDGATKIATVAGTTHTATRLVPSSEHTYTVVARDAAGNVSGTGSTLSLTMPAGEASADIHVGRNVTQTVDVPVSGGATLPVTVAFSNVTRAGELVVVVTDDPPAAPPSGASFMFLGRYFDVSFSGTFTGTIQVTLPYDPLIPDARALELMLVHWHDGAWESVPVTVDTVNHTITGDAHVAVTRSRSPSRST